MENEIWVDVSGADVNQLIGRVLTIIDSAIPEGNQNTATKDILKGYLWDWFYSKRKITTVGSVGNVTISQ